MTSDPAFFLTLIRNMQRICLQNSGETREMDPQLPFPRYTSLSQWDILCTQRDEDKTKHASNIFKNIYRQNHPPSKFQIEYTTKSPQVTC